MPESELVGRSRPITFVSACVFDLSALTNTDPPAETWRPSPAGSAASTAPRAGSHATAATTCSGTANATGSAARSTTRPATGSTTGSAAPSATGPYKCDEALVEFGSVIFVKDIERCQTHVRDFLLIKNHLRTGIVVRHIHCRHGCRCATRQGQGNPGGTHEWQGYISALSSRSLLRLRHREASMSRVSIEHVENYHGGLE
jgi:hypothetical protein